MTRLSALWLGLLFASCSPDPSRVCGTDDGLDGRQPSAGCEMRVRGDGDPPTGIETCADGSLNRFASPSCPLCYDVAVCGRDDSACQRCAAGETCVEESDGCRCVTVCTSDDDCGADEACMCPGDGGDQVGTREFPICVQAACRRNEDCGAGGLCGIGAEGCGGVRGFFCRTPVDQCSTNESCEDDGMPLCFFDPTDSAYECAFYADC